MTMVRRNRRPDSRRYKLLGVTVFVLDPLSGDLARQGDSRVSAFLAITHSTSAFGIGESASAPSPGQHRNVRNVQTPTGRSPRFSHPLSPGSRVICGPQQRPASGVQQVECPKTFGCSALFWIRSLAPGRAVDGPRRKHGMVVSDSLRERVLIGGIR